VDKPSAPLDCAGEFPTVCGLPAKSLGPTDETTMDNQRTFSDETQDSAWVVKEEGNALPSNKLPVAAALVSKNVMVKSTKKSDASKHLPDFDNPRMFTLLLHSEIRSVENNKLFNARSLNNLFNGIGSERVRLYGKTWFLDCEYNFPIFCSRHEFATFLRDVKRHKDRKILFAEGVLTKAMFEEHRYVWRNFLSAPSSFKAGSSSLSLGIHSVANLVAASLSLISLFLITFAGPMARLFERRLVVVPDGKKRVALSWTTVEMLATEFQHFERMQNFYCWQKISFGNIIVHADVQYYIEPVCAYTAHEYVKRVIDFKMNPSHKIVVDGESFILYDADLYEEVCFFLAHPGLESRVFLHHETPVNFDFMNGTRVLVKPDGLDFEQSAHYFVHADFYEWQLKTFFNVVTDPGCGYVVSPVLPCCWTGFDYVVRVIMHLLKLSHMPPYDYVEGIEIFEIHNEVDFRNLRLFLPEFYHKMLKPTFVEPTGMIVAASAASVFEPLEYYKNYNFTSIMFVVVNVVLEEVFKHVLFPYYGAFIIGFLEYGFRLLTGVRVGNLSIIIIGLFPLSFHILTNHLTFEKAVLLHLLWNLCVPRFVEYLTRVDTPILYVDTNRTCVPFPFPGRLDSPTTYSQRIEDFERNIRGSLPEVIFETMKKASPNASEIEEFAYALDVVNKLYHKDVTGLILSAGMKANHLSNLLKMLQIKNAGVLVHWIHDGHIIMLGTADPVMNVLDMVLPTYIAKSTFFRRISALGVFVACSSFVQDISFVKAIANLIPWDQFEGASTFMEIAVGAVIATYQSLMRVCSEGGTWKDLFGLPADVEFIRLSRGILMERADVLTLEEVSQRILMAEDLIKMREFKVNTGEITGLINKLMEFIKRESDRVDNFRKRFPPMPIWINGAPGTGKTVCQDILADVFRKVLGVKEFVGDTVFYNILLKFPGEINKSRRALFFIANDLPAEYANFAMSDREALDIVLQRLLDTAPFEIRSAAVEEKGKALNDLKIAMFSSNYTAFVGEQNSEKLIRRLQSGVSVEVAFEDDSGKVLKYKDVEHLHDHDRNAMTKFYLAMPVSSQKTFTFYRDERKKPMNLPEFIGYCVERYKNHEDKMKREWDKFHSPNLKCECGAPITSHYVTNDGERKWYRISDSCQQIYGPDERYSYEGSRNLSFSTIFEYLFVGCVSVVIFRMVQFYYANASLIRNTVAVSRSFKFVYNRIRKFKDSTYDISRDYAFQWFLLANKIEMFTRRHSTAILAMSVAMASYYVMKKVKTEETANLGNPIFREQVDPDSMFLIEKKKESAFSPDQIRKWNKKEGEIHVAEIYHVGAGLNDLVKMIKRNTVEASILCHKDGRDSSYTVTVVFINPKWMIMNKHYLIDQITNRKLDSFQLVIEGRMQAYLIEEMISIEESEFFLLRNHFDSAVVNLSDHLVIDPGKGTVDLFDTLHEQQILGELSTLNCPSDGVVYPALIFEGVGLPGDCGNAILLNTPKGWCIGGFIFAGTERINRIYGTKTNVIAAFIITRKHFINAAKKCIYPEVHSHKIEMLGLDIGPLSPNADVRNFTGLTMPGLIPVGTLKKAGQTFHSKIIRTKFYDDFAPRLSEEYGPPRDLRGIDSTGEYDTIFLETFRNVSAVNEVPRTIFESCMVGYLNDAIPPGLIEAQKIDLCPLPVEDGLFGKQKIGIDKVPFSTSVGRTLKELGCNNKNDLFDLIPDTEPPLYRLKPAFLEMLKKLLNSLKEGVLPTLLLDFRVKDEVRKLSKLKAFKIRLFGVSDFHYNLLLRCYVMPIIMVLMTNPHMSECYGGMNAGSKAWTELAIRLKKFGFFIDMDFSTFDSTHSMFIIQLVAEFFYLAAIRCKYDIEDATILYYLILMLDLQVLIYNLDVMLKMFGLPSGVIVTLIMNSVVNSILIRVAFVLLTKKRASEFRSFVVVATCGDDNVTSVCNSIIEVFNMITIQQVYRAVGYTVTNADKSGEIRKHIPFENLTFLKRKFVWSDEMSAFLAPIELDSIFKALCFQSKDANLTPRQRLCDVAQTVQREAWLHGRDFFEQTKLDLVEVFEKHQMTIGLRLLDWNMIAEEFRNGTFTTFMC